MSAVGVACTAMGSQPSCNLRDLRRHVGPRSPSLRRRVDSRYRRMSLGGRGTRWGGKRANPGLVASGMSRVATPSTTR